MQTIKDILEVIFFICGPLVAYFTFKVLGQINESRMQDKGTKLSQIINSKRESYKMAAVQCSYFNTTIVPLIDKLDKTVKANGITFFEKSQVNFVSDIIKVKPFYQDNEEKNKVFNLPNLELFNALESFSMFFASGVASEKIGYLTIGTTYCNAVGKYAPLLATLSDGKHFNNTLYLYKIWNARQQKEQQDKEKRKIDKKASIYKKVYVNSVVAD